MVRSRLYRVGKNRLNGFTLIELLIVIIVIAILVAITVVAYNGIQKRAQTAAYVAAVDQVEKSIHAAYALNNSAFSSITQEDSQICIGTLQDFPEKGVFHEDECTVGLTADGQRLVMGKVNEVAYARILDAFPSFRVGKLPVVKLSGDEGGRQSSREGL